MNKFQKIDGINFENWGDKEIKEIARFYGKAKKNKEEILIEKFIDEDRLIIDEWKEIRSFSLKEGKGKSTITALHDILVDIKDLYPNFYKIVSTVLSLHINTVCCERGFPILNIVKIKLRNSFTNENIDYLMRIMLEGDNIVATFNFNEALKNWKYQQNRLIRIK